MADIRKRVRLPVRVDDVWEPRWEPEIKLWSIKYIRDNKWRYEHIHDFEDLVQDAYMVFLKVCDSYPRVVEAPHFMSLYKTSLRNFFTDKSREVMRKSDIIDENAVLDVEAYGVDHTCGEVTNFGTVTALINSAPEEVRLFFKSLHDEEFIFNLQKPQRKGKALGQPRKTFDQRVSSLLGLEGSFPFKKQLQLLLQQ